MDTNGGDGRGRIAGLGGSLKFRRGRRVVAAEVGLGPFEGLSLDEKDEDNVRSNLNILINTEI